MPSSCAQRARMRSHSASCTSGTRRVSTRSTLRARPIRMPRSISPPRPSRRPGSHAAGFVTRRTARPARGSSGSHGTSSRSRCGAGASSHGACERLGVRDRLDEPPAAVEPHETWLDGLRRGARRSARRPARSRGAARDRRPRLRRRRRGPRHDARAQPAFALRAVSASSVTDSWEPKGRQSDDRLEHTPGPARRLRSRQQRGRRSSRGAVVRGGRRFAAVAVALAILIPGAAFAAVHLISNDEVAASMPAGALVARRHSSDVHHRQGRTSSTTACSRAHRGRRSPTTRAPSSQTVDNDPARERRLSLAEQCGHGVGVLHRSGGRRPADHQQGFPRSGRNGAGRRLSARTS